MLIKLSSATVLLLLMGTSAFSCCSYGCCDCRCIANIDPIKSQSISQDLTALLANNGVNAEKFDLIAETANGKVVLQCTKNGKCEQPMSKK